MNKSTLCLLVFAVTLGLAVGQSAYLEEEETIMNYGSPQVSSSPLQVAAPWYSFITNWIHN